MSIDVGDEELVGVVEHRTWDADDIWAETLSCAVRLADAMAGKGVAPLA